jgi:phosphoribosylanthranilate isomerase
MPSGPGAISDEVIAEIAALVPPPVATVLLSCETDPEAIVAHVRRCRPQVVQLVDAVADLAALRRSLPAVKLVQVIHVRGAESLEESARAWPEVDALLLDSGDPQRRELGGTGRVHDWSVSRLIVERSPKPVFLAGGLTPENAAEAVRAVRPFGVDVCSGVRTRGALDADKLMRFFAAIRS